MPRSNPFQDIAEGLEEESTDNTKEESNLSEEKGKIEKVDSEKKNNGLPERPIEKSVPSFDWSDTSTVQVYILEDTEKGLDDIKFDAEIILRQEFGIRKVETRELDEAMITALLKEISPEQIAHLLVEKRGYTA